MAAKTKSDVLQALADWNAGKPVKSLELGHSHRMAETTEPTQMPRIDLSQRFHRDQDRAHAYCFKIIEEISQGKAKIGDHSVDPQNPVYRGPETHEEFLDLCHVIEESFRLEDDGLTPEERTGAVSLAWKALTVGWERAIAGHDPSMYITVTNPAVVASAT